MEQIVLPLALGPGSGPERIVVGNANAGAVEALANPASWPFRTALLFGPARSGKSLLARWFVESGQGDAIDDADRIDEIELFHRWNRAQELGVPLLLTVALGRPDDETAGEMGGWAIALPDLASRLGAAMHLAIGSPDDAMLADLISAHADARGLALGEDGVRYLATRCERSHVGVERLVATIDRLSLERKVAPGLAIWRDALEVLAGPSQPRLL